MKELITFKYTLGATLAKGHFISEDIDTSTPEGDNEVCTVYVLEEQHKEAPELLHEWMNKIKGKSSY